MILYFILLPFLWMQDCTCCNILQHSCVATSGQSGAPMWDPHLIVRSILTGKVISFSLSFF